MIKQTLPTTLLIGLMGQVALSSVAGAGDPPRLLWGNPGSFGSTNVLDNNQMPDTDHSAPGAKLLNAFDNLRGNGTPSGYMVTHGNIISDTVIISLNGRRLAPNRDYFLDTLTGSISFSRAIAPDESVHATYRCSDAKVVARSFAGLPLLPQFFNGNGGATGNFLHAYQSADPKAGLPFDVVTYGLNLNFDLGKTGFETMYYTSDPRERTTSSLLDKPTSNANQPKAVTDTIIVQKATVDMGSMRLSVGYQDIGQSFSGFRSLKEQTSSAPNILAQLEKERGVRRMQAGLDFRPSTGLPAGTPWNRLGWMQMYDSKGSMQAIELTYNTPSFGVFSNLRNVDPGFTRLASLSASELTQLALSTRRQFDPNATAGQVTLADQQAVAAETGISRQLVNTYVKLGGKVTSTLSLLNIEDGKGAISKQTLSLSSQSWQGSVSFQTIGSSFSKLRLLAPTEKLHFGNEFGLRRTVANLNAKLGSKLLLTSNYSLVNSDTGGVNQVSMGLAGKYLNFKANYQNIDPTFTRIADLADSQRASMLSDLGFRKYDMAFGGQISKALTLDTAMARSNNSHDVISGSKDVFNMLYAPSDRTKITYQHNTNFRRSQGDVLGGALNEVQAIEQRFKNNWYISHNRTSALSAAAGGTMAGTITSMDHFETDKADRQWLSWDNRNVNYMNDKFEKTAGYVVQSKLNRNITVQGAFNSVDRGNDPSEDQSRVNVKWAASKTINVGLDMLNRRTNYAGDGNGYLANLGGQVFKRLGPLSQVNLTAQIGAMSMSEGASTYTRGLKMDSLWGRNIVGLEYSHLQLENGQRPFARGYSFKTDTDPKKWYHLDLYYKDKDAGWGKLQPVRNINTDFRLGPSTQLAYTVNQYKELPSGLVDMSVARSLKLTTKVANSLNLVVDFRHDSNSQAQTDIVKTLIGIQRQAGKGMVFDFYVGLDKAGTPSGFVNGQSIKMTVDHQINADHFLSFTGEAIRWDNSNPSIKNRTAAEARLDFRTLFSL